MTVQTMTPEEVRRHDKRGERDRRCNDCSTPITQYSRSGLCGPCVLRQRAAERVCERCGKGCQPGKKLCARCDYHENGPRSKYASKPTEAQRKAWTTSKQRTSTLKKASEAWCPKSQLESHAHWQVQASLPDENHYYRQECKFCGEVTYVNPWSIEDEAREKLTQRMRTGASLPQGVTT